MCSMRRASLPVDNCLFMYLGITSKLRFETSISEISLANIPLSNFDSDYFNMSVLAISAQINPQIEKLTLKIQNAKTSRDSALYLERWLKPY